MGLRYGKERQPAEITKDQEDGRDCVFAECLESENSVGPIWGHGEASVRRALAQLTDECDCGARYHYED